MKIRFFHARILVTEDFCLSCKGENTSASQENLRDSINDLPFFLLEEGELWVEKNRISYIQGTLEGEVLSSSSDSDPDTITWDREIDCLGNLLLPGFKNAHTHSPMVFLRSFADDLPLQEWLYNRVFPAEAKLVSEDIYHLSKVAILEYLSSGITANFDMYPHFDANAKASVDMGFRTVFCGSVNDFTGSIEGMEEEYLRLNQENECISYQLGFHAEYTTSAPLIKKIAALAEKYSAPVYMHNSETKKEVAECKERYGMTPVAYLEAEGIFAYGGGGYHMVHLTEKDMEICARKGIYAITCPASNLKLASGIAPLTRLDKRGIPLAIGTDGPASNNCLDMFREMYLSTALQKHREEEASAFPARKVLAMAISGGAKAMQLPECDCLSPGKYADLILLDMHQPNMQPENHILENIVYSGSKNNVLLTMVNGRILYEKGNYYVGEEVDEIYETAARITRRISP